eukprot:scaffold34015_cov54-Attheya_sp.AAC.3
MAPLGLDSSSFVPPVKLSKKELVPVGTDATFNFHVVALAAAALLEIGAKASTVETNSKEANAALDAKDGILTTSSSSLPSEVINKSKAKFFHTEEIK